MKFRIIVLAFISILVALPMSVFAVDSVLTGTFDGSEQSTSPLPGTCGGSEPLGYLEVGTFQVSVGGLYTIVDAYNFVGVDISAVIYVDSFNPNSPETGLVTEVGVDVAEDITLNAGVNYVLVVQLYCTNPERVWVNRQGAWAVTFSGPGEVASDSIAAVPAMTMGTFTGGDPTSDTECGNSQYHESGPVQVATSGTYTYLDISIYYDIDMCLQVYTAPFNPGAPEANRVTIMSSDEDFMDDEETVELVAGQDYYFVAQPLGIETNGDYFYIFAAPAFDISYAMSGGWFNPETSGQGFLIDVLDNINSIFLAWFTYDLERPPAGTPAMIGDPGHRWLTAFGPTVGSTADLKLAWSSGMIFDSANPPVSTIEDGTMTVEFHDCLSGLITYDLGASGRMGQIPIVRLVNDAVALCETLSRGPAMPGPL